MTNLKDIQELKIAKDYYKAKYLYIKMKIKKLQKSTEPDTEYKKTIVEDTITIEYKKTISNDKITIVPISENESEAEPESDNTVSSFFNTMIIQETNSKIKRSDAYVAYVNFCKIKQYEPLIKSIFFKSIESFLGKPKKTNVYYYMQFCFVTPNKPLSFNETIDSFIF